MRDALVADYERERKAPYVLQPRDTRALKEIVACSQGNVQEAVLRFRRGLREKKILKKRCDTIFDLAQNWNALTKSPIKRSWGCSSGCGCGEGPCMCEVSTGSKWSGC